MGHLFFIVFVVGLLVFSLCKGYIGIYGSAVYRTENPILYWGQMVLLGLGTIVLGVAVARGDL
jgi:hypothetical protein